MNVEKHLNTLADLGFFTTGTKDQRGFATDIRKSFVEYAADFRNSIKKVEMLPAFDKSIEVITFNNDAIWWINNKTASAKDLILSELKKHLS